MAETLSKGFGGDLIPTNPHIADVEPTPNEVSQATAEDEAAATDPLGRTNDGPTAVNRPPPPTADHYGRDTAETGG